MVQFPGDVRRKVLLQLSLLLCHQFPVVSAPLQASSVVAPRPRPLQRVRGALGLTAPSLTRHLPRSAVLQIPFSTG